MTNKAMTEEITKQTKGINLRFGYKGTRVKQRMMVNYAGHCFYSQNSYLCYEVANIHTVCK